MNELDLTITTLKEAATAGVSGLFETWSDAARAASIVARRSKAKGRKGYGGKDGGQFARSNKGRPVPMPTRSMDYGGKKPVAMPEYDRVSGMRIQPRYDIAGKFASTPARGGYKTQGTPTARGGYKTQGTPTARGGYKFPTLAGKFTPNTHPARGSYKVSGNRVAWGAPGGGRFKPAKRKR